MDRMFEEHTKHSLISVRIIRSFCPKHVAEFTEAFGANLRLTSVTARTFHLPIHMNYMHTRALDDVVNSNHTDQISLGYA